MKDTFNARNLSTANKMIAVLVAVVIGITGYILISSRAASPFAAVELEQGATSGQTKSVIDDSASGGVAIQFGSEQVQAPSAAAPTDSWPNGSSTGYKKAPGYPGSLTKFTGTVQSGQTYKFMDFTGETSVGSLLSNVNNVTFIGCRFAASGSQAAVVATYGDNITFQYSTFEPSATATGPVDYSAGYLYGIDQRAPGKITVDHSDFWGWGAGIHLSYSNAAKPVTVKDSWFHDARNDGGTDTTSAILENVGGGQSSITLTHNTMVSAGNTSAIALQGGEYSNLSITGNYLAGFGYTVNLGGKGSSKVVFTDNTLGEDIKPVSGSVTGWDASIGTWKGNKAYSASATTFWLPDGKTAATDYAG